MPLIAEQTHTAEYIHIFVEKCGDRAPQKVRVFLYDEGNVRDATYIEDEDRWQIKTRSFNVEDRIVSLRDGTRRTGCARATRKPTREGRFPNLAQYVFKCDEFVSAWQALTITNDAELPISTHREFPGEVACVEESIGDGSTDLGFVAWQKEIISVQFGDPGKLSHEYYDMVIRKNVVFPGKPVKDELVVKRAVVLKQQAIRGGRGAGSNAATIRDDFNLDASVKTVTLKRVE